MFETSPRPSCVPLPSFAPSPDEVDAKDATRFGGESRAGGATPWKQQLDFNSAYAEESHEASRLRDKPLLTPQKLLASMDGEATERNVRLCLCLFHQEDWC